MSASDEPQLVRVKVTDPQLGQPYQLTLAAHNADGQTSASLMLHLPAPSEEGERAPCHVPNLTGDTLAAARHALRRAHCRVGHVHRPAHHHGTLYVSAQGAPAGAHLAGGARVGLTLGAKRASRRS